MAEIKATAKLLKTVPFLRGLSHAACDALARQASERSFKSGALIFREGAPGATLYIIKEGEVEIFKGRGKNAVTLARRGAGEFFGEMGILEEAKRSASVRARGDVTLIEAPGRIVIQTLLANPKVLLETTRTLSRSLRQSDTQMILGLKKKNAELARAYRALQAAQEEIIEKKRIERELELARELQDSLLPRAIPPIEEFRFAGRSRPAEAVGGDFFDVVPIGSKFFGLLIASVAGTGLFAAIFMALTRALVVAEGERQLSPKLVATRVHQLLLQLAKPTMPVRMFYGVVDVRDRSMKYVNAGHAAPLWHRADGLIESLPGQGTLLAESYQMDVEERSVAFKSGDALVLYTDGLLLAANAAGELYGADRLKAILSGEIASPEAMIDRVLADVDAHCGGRPRMRDQALLIAGVNR
ncbi:MAG TPA: SpoIIE family protein phosphatase [Anaerolineae bacterium]|nr:SpoIIE family protein phosphatase [Anaerolineae bacterium]